MRAGIIHGKGNIAENDQDTYFVIEFLFARWLCVRS
jgi:hypothetical protein